MSLDITRTDDSVLVRFATQEECGLACSALTSKIWGTSPGASRGDVEDSLATFRSLFDRAEIVRDTNEVLSGADSEDDPAGYRHKVLLGSGHVDVFARPDQPEAQVRMDAFVAAMEST